MRTAVVGGGVAGLAAAWGLRNRAEVTVFEPGRMGGKLQTASFAGGMVELGADSFLTRVPEAVQLCRNLGMEDELVPPAANGVLLLTGGRLRQLPGELVMGAPRRIGPVIGSGVLSPLGIGRAALDRVLPRRSLPADPSVWDLVASRYGRQVAARLVDPLVGSIHAGRIEELSAAATAPQLLTAAATSRSLMNGLRHLPAGGPTAGPTFLAPRSGMGELSRRLVTALQGSGVRFVAQRIERVVEDPASGWRVLPEAGTFDAVILALPAHESARLLGRLAPSGLATIPTASVGVVSLAYPRSALPLPAGISGILVERAEGTLMTACSFASAKWPHWVGDATVVRVSVGRRGDEQWMSFDDAGLVAAVHREVGAALGVDPGDPIDGVVARWPDAFPQYGPGHLARVDDLEAELRRRAPGVILAGSSYRGVGIPACIASGTRAAGLLAAVPAQ